LTIFQRLQAINLFGPIFAKELRIASRRRRNYVLRTLYVALLTFVVVMAWFSVVAFSSTRSIDRVATMSRAAVGLLCTIAWFQFIALQLLAPVLTSTAISDEITHGTLGSLMMTPINSLQIVTGKLFSRLLLMILLVATTLPVLAIIRVFG
jgi:ABC-type transport system involved in multi-copper enzyme maturation permease subunit